MKAPVVKGTAIDDAVRRPEARIEALELGVKMLKQK